jgi:hypothetical protein
VEPTVTKWVHIVVSLLFSIIYLIICRHLDIGYKIWAGQEIAYWLDPGWFYKKNNDFQFVLTSALLSNVNVLTSSHKLYYLSQKYSTLRDSTVLVECYELKMKYISYFINKGNWFVILFTFFLLSNSFQVFSQTIRSWLLFHPAKANTDILEASFCYTIQLDENKVGKPAFLNLFSPLFLQSYIRSKRKWSPYCSILSHNFVVVIGYLVNKISGCII